MKEGLFDVSVVMDTSFPTLKFKEETEAGLNYFLKSLSVSGMNIKLSLTVFDDFYYNLYSSIDPIDAPEFKLVPKGNRALIDALGKTIKNTGYRLAKLNEEDRPSKVIIIVITSGLGNCAAYYNKADIQEMVKHQQDKYNWKFIFIGPTLDDAEAFGIPVNNLLEVAPTYYGVRASYDSLVKRMYENKVNNRMFFEYSDRLAQDFAGGVFSEE